MQDTLGNYLISYAIIKNNKEIVELLIENECRIDILDQEGRSILYLPIKYDYRDIIKILVNYNKHSIGISIADFKDRYNNIPLHYAIFFKNIEAFNLLLGISNTSVRDSDGNNSLHLATYSKNYEMCEKVLIKENININARSTNGETALHIATNLELEDIIKLLLDYGVNPNVQDYEGQLTPLMYLINLNNSKLSKLLLDTNTLDINVQDYMGNTALHHCVLQDNNEILFEILNDDKVNFNIHNIESKLPIHLFLEKEREDNINLDAGLTEIMIDQSNLNYQDNNGNTALHFICKKKELWVNFRELLITKKLNIFIFNKSGERPIDYISNNDLNTFISLIIDSYLYILHNYNFTWSEEWENMCAKTELYTLTNSKNDKKCSTIIKEKLMKIYKDKDQKCGFTSYPFKINKKCIEFLPAYENRETEMCSFVGITLDILCGLIYLLSKYKNACSTISSNFIKNDDLCSYYSNIGIKTNTKCEFLNFEIVWIYKKLFFSENFVDSFKKCQTRFIIIPLGIELKVGSHANYLIYDRKVNEIERFEPYGSEAPHGFNYDMNLLDSILEFKFKEINKDMKYVKPADYLPKIGFQHFDIFEEKTSKIGDPKGFCALWSIWYTDNRLKYPDVNRKSLVKKLVREIKMQNISFRNLIRNYSVAITDIRDKVLSVAGLTINDWLNDQVSEDQYKKVVIGITKLLQKHIKV
ncbi:MAG: ankyrin repeat protein [Barrevirus sp.]|uniref:Ankyrin repeat protein n=1 Tax=Barrevirus sp. TaxID=2487763 RepID=A0A3G4ZUF9_9VIRU|nr:MAG: ankyrin repeat protein [Barrevirus sp.]